MRCLITLALFCALIVPQGFAQTAKAADDSSAITKSNGIPPQTKLRPSRSSTQQESFSSWDYWTNLIIQPGASINLDSRIDYSLSDTVRVTILSANMDLRDLVTSAFWSVPQLRFFNAADVVTGEGSYYVDARSATFRTYGSEFRLRLTNLGTTPVTLSQVLIFAQVL